MLTQSGVDYVYVDLTNLCTKSASEDLLQRRPMEVLFEEWHKLRTQGKQTPQIVAWNKNDEPGLHVNLLFYSFIEDLFLTAQVVRLGGITSIFMTNIQILFGKTRRVAKKCLWEPPKVIQMSKSKLNRMEERMT